MFYNVAVVAMSILAAWSAFWVGLSITHIKSKDKISKAFWRMSLGWGAINLMIAAFGFLQAQTKQEAFSRSLTTQAQQVQIIGINVLLDLLYIFVAALLIHYATKKTPQRLGYGRAILVQGIFLLIFDITLVIALDTVRI